MTLIITQTQINTFERCKRCYYLRYVRKLSWPGSRVKNEEMRRGEDFHLIVRQLTLGISREQLIIPAEDEALRKWTDAWCREKPLKDFQTISAEKEVSALFEDVLWLGKFDVLALSDGRITIFDWKTTGHPRSAKRYQDAPQTRLYRFLAKSCGARLLGAGLHAIPAENIEMVYWFPEHPRSAIRLPYSEEAWQDDLSWLRLKAREMSYEDEDHYPRTKKEKDCAFCDYFKLCHPEQSAIEPVTAEEDPFDEIYQTGFVFMDPGEEEEQEGPGF